MVEKKVTERHHHTDKIKQSKVATYTVCCIKKGPQLHTKI